MIEGINVEQLIEFTFSDDKDPKTVIVLKPLTGMQMMEIKGAIDMMEKTIVEIRNQPNALAPIEYVKTLGLAHINELIQKVNAINKVQVQDAKNS